MNTNTNTNTNIVNNQNPKTNNSIHLLDRSVIEKIAAGEVIERPASVVKELIENAIDAGATLINIVIEDAGFSLIKIIDNGLGMGYSDLQMCLLRHATSKIASAQELFSIATMGFRGEALASIAAVSRLSITSCDNNDGLGFSITSQGGEASPMQPESHSQGTTISCQNLFFNVPARKKFMKSPNAERLAIMRSLEQLVISFPAIHFTCISDGKRSFDYPAVDTLQMRIAQVAGIEFAKNLIRCTGEESTLSAEIYISRPQDGKIRPRFQNLYVNLRRIDNDSTLYAIREAFSRFIKTNLKPAWFCFLDIDPARVDVNIHPAKMNIKFDNEKELFRFIYHTCYNGISSLVDIRYDYTGNMSENSPGVHSDEDNFTAESPMPTFTSRNDQGIEVLFGDNPPCSGNVTHNRQNLNTQPEENAQQTSLSFLSMFHDTPSDEKNLHDQQDEKVSQTNDYWKLISCYQIHKRYILAPIKNGFIVIDQHAAHERILYEEALADLKKGKCDSQRLLFPITFNMSAPEKEVILKARDYFANIGFDIQDFGGQTVAVSAIPAGGFLRTSKVEEAIREMVQNIIDEKDETLLSDPHKKFAASFACGAAIKFGKELKPEEMNNILNSLFATKSPYICPHGRPTLIRISLDELKRRFLR